MSKQTISLNDLSFVINSMTYEKDDSGLALHFSTPTEEVQQIAIQMYKKLLTSEPFPELKELLLSPSSPRLVMICLNLPIPSVYAAGRD